MTNKLGLQNGKMAGRILARADNLYKKEVVKNVLDMYADEIQKALLNGERVLISGVGTIIPEVKTHIGNYNMPVCNKSNINGSPPPYTKIRMTRTHTLTEKMNQTLLKNIDNGILGLKKLPFDVQQINILKNSGYIPDTLNENKEK
ncbi:MAG: HU family DNA-binding protein [Lachnospiraceae bacterium]|nr:HU family DNA-binding protein [Lachnospiraceae bacterium]